MEGRWAAYFLGSLSLSLTFQKYILLVTIFLCDLAFFSSTSHLSSKFTSSMMLLKINKKLYGSGPAINTLPLILMDTDIPLKKNTILIEAHDYWHPVRCCEPAFC